MIIRTLLSIMLLLAIAGCVLGVPEVPDDTRDNRDVGGGNPGGDGDGDKESHSNAGRGNGSEGNPDEDPGNSGDHNEGGD